jgi:hypothetical protein
MLIWTVPTLLYTREARPSWPPVALHVAVIKKLYTDELNRVRLNILHDDKLPCPGSLMFFSWRNLIQGKEETSEVVEPRYQIG